MSATTIEFRLPDGSAHPHLLLAGVAQALVAAGIADVLATSRAMLEAGGVFPGGMMELVAAALMG